ncbi:MAG: hypothetical protein GXP19_01615 [Gammaproteobacteria bacterium]|nr:hypothetical protein [Gammaproteobacteria bacterium]
MQKLYFLIVLLLSLNTAHAGEWSGFASLESRYFYDDASSPLQSDSNSSFAFQPEYRTEWDKGYQSLTFTPFARLDSQDAKRSHVDIRELLWIKAEKNWELRAGIGKVFWGVTESQHLVDIINQTDLVENSNGEDKLGQPMINVSLIRNWGIIDLFVLPGFRERTFPGAEGRLRSNPRVDTSQAVYESSREEKHIDLAARWSKTIGDWDVGLSHFYGTSREPAFSPGEDNASNPVLIPHYELINQTGIDIQATLESWLWKLEAIHRSGQNPSFNALTAGLEYSFYGIYETDTDLGIVAEYLYDNRDETAPTPFQNDILIALRFALNDIQSTDALIGTIIDLDNDTVLYTAEASRRLGESWKLNLEIRAFQSVPIKDDHILLDLAYYF